MNISEIEKVVKAFQGAIFKRSSSVSAGLLRSKIRGTGLQFRDHQIYSHGDDVRFIDWKVSARNTNIHLKTFEEERNSQIFVFFDLAPTMFYGSAGITKLQMALEICALLYLLTQKTNDQLTLLVFLNDRVITLPPQKGRLGIVALIKQLERNQVYTEQGEINLRLQRKLRVNQEATFQSELKRVISKRKDVIFISDFNFQETFIKDAQKSKYFHPMRIVSPVDVSPLRFSINSGDKKGTGVSFFKKESTPLATLSTSEKYLELFLRRLR